MGTSSPEPTRRVEVRPAEEDLRTTLAALAEAADETSPSAPPRTWSATAAAIDKAPPWWRGRRLLAVAGLVALLIVGGLVALLGSFGSHSTAHAHKPPAAPAPSKATPVVVAKPTQKPPTHRVTRHRKKHKQRRTHRQSSRRAPVRPATPAPTHAAPPPRPITPPPVAARPVPRPAAGGGGSTHKGGASCNFPPC